MKWEYMMMARFGRADMNMETLQELGGEGWELVCQSEHNWYFKRQKPLTPEEFDARVKELTEWEPDPRVLAKIREAVDRKLRVQ